MALTRSEIKAGLDWYKLHVKEVRVFFFLRLFRFRWRLSGFRVLWRFLPPFDQRGRFDDPLRRLAGLLPPIRLVGDASPARRDKARGQQHHRHHFEFGNQHRLQHSFSKSHGFCRDRPCRRGSPTSRKQACGLDCVSKQRPRHRRRGRAGGQRARHRTARKHQSSPQYPLG